MPRLFTAIKIPFHIGQMLSLIRGKIPGARWMDASDYHITLRFLGDVSDDIAGEVDFQLTRQPQVPFKLYIDHLDIFGSKKPRLLYAGVKHNEALWVLQREHEQIMQQIGLAPEGRKYAPHVTLARFGPVRRQDVEKFMLQQGLFAPKEFLVEEVALFSAKDSIGGGPYLVEEIYPFKK